MSTKKIRKSPNWGGLRRGAGAKPRPDGTIKICVSINKKTWHDALRSWSGRASHLVEKLVSAYVKEGESSQKSEAII
jgi:hypothetical protein